MRVRAAGRTPCLDPGRVAHGERGSTILRGEGVRAAGAGPAADPEDDRDGAEPGDDTGDEVEGHDAALLTLVYWSMRRPQMTLSIVIPQPWSSDATRGSCRCRRSPRVFLDRRDEVRRAEEGDGVADLDVVGGNGDDHDADPAVRSGEGRCGRQRVAARPRPGRNRAGGTRGLEGDGEDALVRPAVDGAPR